MAESDLSLSDALSDCLDRPAQEALVHRDFVAQLEAEAFDDQIGETVGKTDYVPLLDGDGTATDVGPALENGQKKAEGVQKPGSKVNAVMQPGRPEPHGEVCPWADPPDLGSDLLVPASMAHPAGLLGSPTSPAQVEDSSPMGAFADLMDLSVAPAPAGSPPSMAGPQQHSPMLPEPQAPRGAPPPAPGSSPGDRWPPADLPFTPSVSTVISRHAGSLAGSPDRPTPEGRAPRESAAYAGGDEKEGDGPDRSKQRRKKKRRQKDEGSWEQPEAQEPPDEGPAPADALYQRVGPHRDRAAGAGAWEEQIGRSGGRAKKGKSRKKLPEEWAATGRPSVPAATQAELGGAVPGPEEPSQGAALGSSGRESYPEDAGLDPDPLDPLDRNLLACPAPPPARSGGLKATAPPFTMPAAGVLLGSSPLSSGPAHSLLGDAVDGALLIDTSAFSPASQPSPLLHASFSASDSSWLAGDSLLSAAAAAGDSSFDLGDLLPPGVGLDPSGPAPLRSPRTTAPDSRAREPASSSTSSSPSPPSPPSAAAPSSPPPPGSHLNPAAKPFFPSLAEPLEAPPPAAPGSALVIEDTQTPGRYVGEDAKDDEMEDQMERLDEYIQLDHGERRREQAEEAGKVENRDEDTLTKQHAANNEMDHGTEAAEEETQEKQTEETAAVCEKMEERVEATPDKPQLGGTRAKGVEEAEHSADGHAEQTIQVSGADQHQETLILERSKPCEKVQTVTVTAATDKTETGDAKATVSQEDCTPQDGQTPNLLDRGFEAPEKEESKMDATKLLESKMDAPKVQESKMDAPKVQESKMDAPKVQESKMDAPKVQESKMDAPKVQESKMDAPKVQESKMDAPKVQESKMDAPKVHESKEEATKVHESKEEATKVQESMVRVTLTEDPKMEVPSMEATKVEKSKVEVTFVEDRKLEGSEAQESTADGVEKSAEEEEVEEVTAEPHEKVEREHREEEKPAGPAVETKDDVAEEGGKTAEKKHKSGKLESPTKKPAAKPSAGGPAPGKEPSSPDKKTKPATTATKLTAATKARPGSAAAAAPTRRPAPAAAPASTSTSMSSTLAKKTPAARPAGAPAASPKRAPAGAGTALRDAKPKTTSTTATATERRVPGSKVTTAPTARSAAGPAPSRNVPTATSRPATAATRATAAPRPALGSATAKPPASKPDSKLGAERKLGPLKTSSADPSKPRTGLGAAARPKSAPLASSAGPAAEKKTLVSRVRPATTSSTSTSTSATTRTSTLTSRTSTSTSRTATTSTTRPSTSTTRPSTSTTRPSTSTTRPTARPGSASNPDTKNVRSKTASTDRMKPQTGVKVSSVSQNKMAASKEPNPGKAHIDSVKPDYSHVTSRLGSKDNMKHVPGGGNVQILNKKVDLGKVTSKCGSKDNIKHKPGGGTAKVESNKVNLKEKAPSKVGSVDNLVGPPEKEEGNTATPAVSGEQGPPEAPPAPPAQENGLKEGGPCGSEGLCDARIPETSL